MTTFALSDAPICYVLTLGEVRASAHRGVNDAGKVSFWLQPKSYAQDGFREAWARLGQPARVDDVSAAPA